MKKPAKKVKETKGHVYLKLNGGLGNQMFQWALARMIKSTTDMDVYLDMSYFKNKYARPYQLDIFKIEPTFVEDSPTKLKLSIIWLLRSFLNGQSLFGITLYSERKFNFEQRIGKIKTNTYIEGFFQSEKYFKFVADALRDDFKFGVVPNEQNRAMWAKIMSCQSVSLHIRRGDYVQKQRYQDQYAECSFNYYKRAVDAISKKYPDLKLFVFSDDIAWVKRNMQFPFETTYIDFNTGNNSYEDLRLMSLCKHNIIANSSFSWWGAWLNDNKEKIVIAPKRWFKDKKINQDDIIPPDWVKFDN